MRSVRFLALTCLFALSISALAAEPTPTAEVVASIEATYKEVTAIAAKFTQTVDSPAFDEIVQKGSLQLQRPMSARWEFKEPVQSALITNGQKMWIWNPAQQVVIIDEDLSGASGGSSDLMFVLTDLSRLEEFFTVESVAGPADEHTLKLTPRNEALKGQYAQLELALSKADMLLKRVSFGNSFDQTTKLEFADVTLNPSLAAGAFTFEPPASAKIINSGEP